jgi:hypothetical protein
MNRSPWKRPAPKHRTVAQDVRAKIITINNQLVMFPLCETFANGGRRSVVASGRKISVALLIELR